MKILATADIHIWDYPQHSTYDDYGVPSRLLAYEYLATDIAQIAHNNNVDLIIIAGDILHGAVAKPMVLNTAKRFFEILDSSCRAKILVIPGQHDLDVKSCVSQHDIHTALSSIIPDGITLATQPRFFNIQGYRVYLQPWMPDGINYEKMPSADIFVGHGAVKTCTDLHGYEFKTGFELKELWQRYRLSIIGDIHNSQVFRHNDSLILIPGQPISTNFSSAEPTGVYIIDYDTLDEQFFKISDFRTDVYHKFLHCDENTGAVKETPFVHVKWKREKVRKLSHQTDSSVARSNFKDVVERSLKRLRLNKQDQILEIVRSAFSTSQGSSRSVPRQQKLLRMEIENFISIDSLGIDFSELSGDLLVVGDNGAGKSSFVEALYWALTGKLTKDLEVAEISNNKLKKPAKVCIVIQVEEDQYLIERSRDGGHNLQLYKLVGDSKTPLTKTSVATTQELIYDILGTKAEEMLAVMYYTVSSSVTFTEMGGSDQVDLLGRLADLDQLNSLKDVVVSKEKELKAETDRLLAECNILKQSSLSLCNQISREESSDQSKFDLKEFNKNLPVPVYFPVNTPSELAEEITKMIDVIKSKLDPTALETFDHYRKMLGLSEQNIDYKLRLIAGIKDELSVARNTLDTCKDTGVCYACKQNTVNEQMLSELRVKIVNKEQELEENKNHIVRLKSIARDIAEDYNNAKVALEKDNKTKELIVTLTEAVNTLLAVSATSEKKTAVDDHIKAQIAKNSSEIETKKVCIESNSYLLDDLKQVSKLLARNGAIATELVSEAMKHVQDTVNEMVRPEILKLSISTGKPIKFQASFMDQESVSLNGFSVGERRLVDTLIMIALNKLIAEKYNLPDGLLGITIFDEVLVYLAPVYSEAVFEALQHIPSPLRIFITHDTAIQSNFDKIMKVTKTNGFSRFTMVS